MCRNTYMHHACSAPSRVLVERASCKHRNDRIALEKSRGFSMQRPEHRRRIERYLLRCCAATSERDRVGLYPNCEGCRAWANEDEDDAPDGS